MKAPHILKRAALTSLALAVLAGSAAIPAAYAADGRRESNRGRDQKQERTVREKKPDRSRRDDRAVQSKDRRHDQRKDRAVRDRDRDRRDERAVRHRDRDRHDNRVVVRHRPTVRHRDLRVCPPPRYVIRPWYGGAHRIYVHDDPFYFHAGLGIYLGGLALRLELGDVPPVGFVYYDPYCDETFWSVADYQYHLRWHRHPQALTVIVADGYYLDD